MLWENNVEREFDDVISIEWGCGKKYLLFAILERFITEVLKIKEDRSLINHNYSDSYRWSLIFEPKNHFAKFCLSHSVPKMVPYFYEKNQKNLMIKFRGNAKKPPFQAIFLPKFSQKEFHIREFVYCCASLCKKISKFEWAKGDDHHTTTPLIPLRVSLGSPDRSKKALG